MYSSPILFVVGAGASKEVNFPLGRELNQKISQVLNFDLKSSAYKASGYQIVEAIQYHTEHNPPQGIDYQAYMDAAAKSSKAISLDTSIDDYLNRHSGNKAIELCGKLAIVKCILDAEKSNLLRSDTSKEIIFSNLNGTWYNSFWRQLSDGITTSNLDHLFNNVSFVVFNYDRCLEYYLVNAITIIFHVNHKRALELVGKLKIIHPYGTVGKIPGLREENPVVDFGEDFNDAGRLLELSGQIYTYTEQLGDDYNIRNVVGEAETIVFLGFAFHRQNLEILKTTSQDTNRRIFATKGSFSQPDCERIIKLLTEIFKPANGSLNIASMVGTCSELFKTYRMSLT